MSLDVIDPNAQLGAASAILSTRTEDIDFESEPRLATRIAALGICREIGGSNDQLSDEVLIHDSNEVVPRELAESDIIEYRQNVGVRVRYRGHRRLAVSIPGFVQFLHPSLSFNSDGTIRELVIFPLTVARIARIEEARLVIVPRWAREMSLAPEPSTIEYYKTFANRDNWARISHWTLHFCRLLESKRIPFFTTHDLTGHIAGFKRSSWPRLTDIAHALGVSLKKLFDENDEPPVQTLILPFMAAHLLDLFSQPRQDKCENISIVVALLIEAVERCLISALDGRTLTRFPPSYGKLVALTLSSSKSELSAEARKLIGDIVKETKRHLE